MITLATETSRNLYQSAKPGAKIRENEPTTGRFVRVDGLSPPRREARGRGPDVNGWEGFEILMGSAHGSRLI
jgi:hypothetical protein